MIRSNNHAETPGPKTQKTFLNKDTTLGLLSSFTQIIQNAQGANENEKLATRSVPPEQGKTMHDKKSSSSRLRTFHFSHSSKNLTAQSMASIHGIRKSRSDRRDLAVFEERTKTARDPPDLNAGFRKGTDLSGPGTETWTEEGIIANPIAQSAVSVGGTLLPEASGANRATSRLRKFEEITECPSQASTLHETKKDQINDAPLQPQVKFQPKPTTTLRQENRPFVTTSEVLPDAPGPENQVDFVYDTYLRTMQPIVGFQPDCPMNIDQFEAIADGKVGILVIAEQDEAAWEAYGEEEESDKDWNSEEEDENGIITNQQRSYPT